MLPLSSGLHLSLHKGHLTTYDRLVHSRTHIPIKCTIFIFAPSNIPPLLINLLLQLSRTAYYEGVNACTKNHTTSRQPRLLCRRHSFFPSISLTSAPTPRIVSIQQSLSFHRSHPASSLVPRSTGSPLPARPVHSDCFFIMMNAPRTLTPCCLTFQTYGPRSSRGGSVVIYTSSRQLGHMYCELKGWGW